MSFWLMTHSINDPINRMECDTPKAKLQIRVFHTPKILPYHSKLNPENVHTISLHVNLRWWKRSAYENLMRNENKTKLHWHAINEKQVFVCERVRQSVWLYG